MQINWEDQLDSIGTSKTQASPRLNTSKWHLHAFLPENVEVAKVPLAPWPELPHACSSLQVVFNCIDMVWHDRPWPILSGDLYAVHLLIGIKVCPTKPTDDEVTSAPSAPSHLSLKAKAVAPHLRHHTSPWVLFGSLGWPNIDVWGQLHRDFSKHCGEWLQFRPLSPFSASLAMLLGVLTKWSFHKRVFQKFKSEQATWRSTVLSGNKAAGRNLSPSGTGSL